MQEIKLNDVKGTLWEVELDQLYTTFNVFYLALGFFLAPSQQMSFFSSTLCFFYFSAKKSCLYNELWGIESSCAEVVVIEKSPIFRVMCIGMLEALVTHDLFGIEPRH